MENLMLRSVNPEFWLGKRVLLTGHTGFKGSWASIWLHNMGATVRGLSLEPYPGPSMFDICNVVEKVQHHICDIRDLSAIRGHFKQFRPEIVIHMAAQPLVRLSYHSPVETFETNVMGTINVLEAAKTCNNLKAIVNVTTDKCYENREWFWGYREDEPMGGHDPYSSSKGCAELVSVAYRKSFLSETGIALATARAGNVIGGGDWSKDRLVPDILRSMEASEPVEIRNPKAVRPWQHVLEPLSGYLMLAESLYGQDGQIFAEGWNFGPKDEDARTVEWIVNEMATSYSDEASWVNQDGAHPHEANFLKLDISKARQKLHWAPRWNVGIALEKTVEWHHAWLKGDDMNEFSLDQITAYLKVD